VDLSTLLDCKHLLNKPVKTLSLGERMKMELIAGLLPSPKIIFFDEPTIGLDIFSQEQIRNFIKQYQKQHQATIILTSHYMEDVKRLAKRLIVINQGKILYDGGQAEIIKKYSIDKYITVVLEQEVEQKVLSSIGKPIVYNFPRLVFKIKKSEIPLTVKKISDHLNKSISSGNPIIWHDRASDPKKNILKEESGIKMNENLWQIIDEIVLTKNTFSGRDVNFIWEFQNQDGSYLVV